MQRISGKDKRYIFAGRSEEGEISIQTPEQIKGEADPKQVRKLKKQYPDIPNETAVTVVAIALYLGLPSDEVWNKIRFAFLYECTLSAGLVSEPDACSFNQ